MKFLFDQSADFRLIPHLRQLGYDVTLFLVTILLVFPMKTSLKSPGKSDGF